MSSCDSIVSGRPASDLAVTSLAARDLMACRSVAEQFSTLFLNMPRGAIPGYVLTTDKYGNANWEPPTSGGGGGSGSGSLSIVTDVNSPVVPNATGQLTLQGQSGIQTDGTAPHLVTIRDLRNLSAYVVGQDSLDSQYTTIQDAVTAADATGNSQTLIIKQGTYTGSTTITNAHTFLSASPELAIVQTTFNINVISGTVLFKDINFNQSVININGTGYIVVFQNCILDGVSIGATGGASVQFFNCRSIRTYTGASITIGNTTNCVMDNTDFSRIPAVTYDNVTFSAPINRCSFNILNMINTIPPSPPVFQFCNFINAIPASPGSVFLKNYPTSFSPSPQFVQFLSCRFDDVQTNLYANGYYLLQNCTFVKGTFNSDPVVSAPLVYITFCINTTFDRTSFPMVFQDNTLVQFIKCDIRLVDSMQFFGGVTSFQSLYWCYVSNYNSSSSLIQLLGSANLRTSHCIFDGDNLTSVPVFHFTGAGTLELFFAEIRCGSSNYATTSGTGKIIRPTTFSGAIYQGTNVMYGPGGVAAGITYSPNVYPWVDGTFKMV